MATSQRLKRIADLIQRHLALLLKKEINDPRLVNVSLVGVDVAPDLSQAKIFFSLVKAEEAEIVTAALNKASGYLRSQLAHSIELRYTPRLIFVYDKTLLSAERIDELLNQIKDEPTDSE